jgi:hypothetical protein
VPPRLTGALAALAVEGGPGEFAAVESLLGGSFSGLGEIRRNPVARLDAAGLAGREVRDWLCGLPLGQDSEVQVAWIADRLGARMSFAAFASNVSDLWFPAMDDIVCVLRSAGSLAVPVFDHDELITLSSVNPRQLKVVAPVRVMLLFPVVRSGSWPSISDHNWPRVWQLGGENVGRGPYATYKEMVAGYRDMMHDDVLAMTATGDTESYSKPHVTEKK